MKSAISGLFILLLLSLSCSTPPKDRGVLVGRTDRDWYDPERTRWDGSGERPLPVTIWYPAEHGSREKSATVGPPGAPFFHLGWVAKEAPITPSRTQFPVVLLSHGTGGSGLDLSWLAESLAAASFVVLAVTHHGNSIAANDLAPEGFFLWWERARDLSIALDRLILDDTFGSLIDPSKVGAAGFSLGGHTVVLVGGARVDLEAFRAYCEQEDALPSSCDPPPEALALAKRAIDWTDPITQASMSRASDPYRDPRVVAVYSMAPAVAAAMTAYSLAAVEVPIRVVVGDADTMAPSAPNAQHIARHVPNASLWTIPDVDHYTFLPTCGWAGRWMLGEICAERTEPSRESVHQQVAEDAKRFFGMHLAEADPLEKHSQEDR